MSYYLTIMDHKVLILLSVCMSNMYKHKYKMFILISDTRSPIKEIGKIILTYT